MAVVRYFRSRLRANVRLLVRDVTAYGESHLGGGKTLRELSDFRGDVLVDGIIGLVRQHRPLHVSLVGGEPMIRHRELDRILAVLGDLGTFTMVVTSGVIPIPAHWMEIPRLVVAVSIDGLPEHHNVRRKPATYEHILANISGRRINVHWVITRPMLSRPSYLEEYVAFWNSQPEVNRIWLSLYSPQTGEQSAERLTAEDRERVARDLPQLQTNYSKLLIPHGMARAFLKPPKSRSNACSPKCRRIILPICVPKSSPASLEGIRIAASAGVASAAHYTGSAI